MSAEPRPHNSKERLLHLLKTEGEFTAAQLAQHLGVSTVAIHQHLGALRREALVEFSKVKAAVGRPAHLWRLTDTGHDQFACSLEEFVLSLLRAVERAFGREGLRLVAEERAREQLENLRKRLPDPHSSAPQTRVEALAEIRRDQGYMAAPSAGGEGELFLTQNHCVIAGAARYSERFCESELRLFRTLLGEDLRVERIEHCLNGGRRCSYRVSAADSPEYRLEPAAQNQPRKQNPQPKRKA